MKTFFNLWASIAILTFMVSSQINYSQTVLDNHKNLQLLLNNGNAPKELIQTGIQPNEFIGLLYAGGIIFHINEQGEGFVASPYDISSNAKWGCDSKYIELAHKKALGTGTENTQHIVKTSCQQNDGITSAAELCYNYNDGTYQDWFLPSIDELHKMYINIGKGSGQNLGHFKDTFYWSSTSAEYGGGWGLNFLFGNKNFDTLFNKSVRPIRAF